MFFFYIMHTNFYFPYSSLFDMQGKFQAYIAQVNGQDQRSENYKLCVKKFVRNVTHENEL